MLLLAGSAATVLLASGCGAGQIAETANKKSTVPGANVELRTQDGGFYKVRNLVVSYNGVEGYQAGANAPIEVAIFNDTDRPVTLTVTSDGARAVEFTGGAEASPEAPAPTGGTPTESPGATGEASPLPAPAEQPAAGGPARIEIPARGFATFNQRTDRQLQLVGLNEPLKSGQSVNLVFDFDGRKLTVDAPVMVPLTPAPVASPVVEVEGGHE